MSGRRTLRFWRTKKPPMAYLSNPRDPNYFPLRSIVEVRRVVANLRDYVSEPGDFEEAELPQMVNELIELVWPYSHSGVVRDDRG